MSADAVTPTQAASGTLVRSLRAQADAIAPLAGGIAAAAVLDDGKLADLAGMTTATSLSSRYRSTRKMRYGSGGVGPRWICAVVK
ncbi:MAG: hypothetical protein AAF488_11495 [Planctomycetota bacterium]